MKRIITVVVLMVCVSTKSIFAQTPTQTSKILTFEEAVKIAMKNSVLINQQKNNLELTQMQKLSSIASIGPSIQANGQVFQVNGNSFNSQTGQLINGVRDAVTGSVSANMNIFSGFSRINSIRQFNNQVDAQAYFVNRTTQDVISTVSTQYLQVMLDIELVRIAKENFDALDKQLQKVKEEVNLGARSQVEEYNQDALTKAAELRMVQAEINLNNDKTILTQTLLIDPFEQYDVERPNWDMNIIGYDTLKVEALTDIAKQYRGDYLWAVKNEASLKYGRAAARGAMLPSLYAFGSYGSAYNFQHDVPDSIRYQTTVVVADAAAPSGYALQNQLSPGLVGNPEKPRPFSEQFRKNNVYKQYGLQLTIPIFNGLQSRASYVQQKTLYENSRLTTKNAEFQVKNDVLRAVRNMEGSKKAYAVSVEQLKAADLAFQLETERYDLGVTNFVDFTNANRTLMQAQTDKAQAEYRLVFQRILLEYALGTLKLEDIETTKN
jgi:outer membrane protein